MTTATGNKINKPDNDKPAGCNEGVVRRLSRATSSIVSRVLFNIAFSFFPLRQVTVARSPVPAAILVYADYPFFWPQMIALDKPRNDDDDRPSYCSAFMHVLLRWQSVP